MGHGAWGMGHGAWGIGRSEAPGWGMGHGAWGMGHGAWAIRKITNHSRFPIPDSRFPISNSLT
ncbi:MAG: hypothetical protein EAZ78_20160 [Oscillatoriales cyanobacterium]|nr:MAG: hypothetical protein EA000_16820 [Oscillatoriales cyanobacterium]TAD95660.1 MAG: hypothetical protein EAZ98_14980 [Oscillatoriales cyanobacterium]TAF00514.1 MAG: hypothetical protein EAZ78_20160 [Oscillatoriales cyanobacterium]TAF38635.1 MAG: hypothetical protein EAZ68_12730 [Oscillatoriales cyanobacterium]TAF70396.1 MAG: hypothetical protein EAZ59_04935 [Oscillatoriales cyanobacterium]